MDKEEKKRLIKEFKATEFGKKAYRNYIIGTIFFIIALIAEAVMYFCDIDIKEYHSIELIVFVITCYYEGYYCGAQSLYVRQHSKELK